MVKRSGQTFSTEPGNLTNTHSMRASGFCQSRIVRITAASNGGVTLSLKRSGKTATPNKPAAAFSKPVRIGSKKTASKVGKQLAGSFYRLDLIKAAKARATAIVRSQARAAKN